MKANMKVLSRLCLKYLLSCLSVLSWQSYVCLLKYLQYLQNTEVTFEKSTELPFPVFIVCPAYSVAYNNTKLRYYGIQSREQYRGGEWANDSTANEREIFKQVTHEVDDILENILIRFANRQPNKEFKNNNMKNLEYRVGVKTRNLRSNSINTILLFEFDSLIVFLHPLQGKIS